MKTIGFAGTAKNTGKTTTALSVLEQSRLCGYKNALTSIGYDGESLDHITGLPKPRYELRPGELVATASECLQASPARCKILAETKIETVMGNILIAEVQEAGLVLLAGPNRESDLRLVLAEFASHGAQFTIVDGALNRIVPLICTDGLILSTGAALTRDASQIAAHAAAIEKIFRLPLADAPAPEGVISLRYANRPARTLPTGSLINPGQIPQLKQAFTNAPSVLSIPGACQPDLLIDILPDLPASTSIHLGSPLKMIASGDALRWSQALERTAEEQIAIDVLQTLPLLLITANPFYPRYLRKNDSYLPAFIHREELMERLQTSVQHTPVFDIFHAQNGTMEAWFHHHIAKKGSQPYAQRPL